MNICLKVMTKELCREYFQKFELDPSLFADLRKYKPYVYSEAECDAYYERYRQLGRVHLAVMLGDEPIGELVLKNLDLEKQRCTLGISLKCDSYKNKGYGTQAEILALEYAFSELGMETVYADALLMNKRSQHVLKKVGFVEINHDDMFRYYRCDKSTWQRPQA